MTSPSTKNASEPAARMDAPIVVSANERANLDYHHGALRPAIGTHNIQVVRANRDAGEKDPVSWTYNHAPMLAWWHDRFYLEYLSNPVAEHLPPGRSLLVTSPDGFRWSPPQVVFPEYRIPRDRPAGAPNENLPEFAVMHQRMGFHIAPNDRLLVLGFYGISRHPDELPFNLRGIGRVVREIRRDGSWGEIHFLRYNRHAGWNESNTSFPFYKSSADEGFVAACDSLLADSLAVQQWQEEHGDADELIRLKGSRKALSYYTLPDGRVAGVWKWQRAGITSDRGKTWDWVGIAPTIASAGGKVWGQRTADGRYALVYNPSTNNKHRWPLAVVTSDDGLDFADMLVVSGEVPPRRYAGCRFKNPGQNYVRGLCERSGTAPDAAMWIAYSMNKEDIWICRVPLPINGSAAKPVDDDFRKFAVGPFVPNWNIYSPLLARVEIAKSGTADGAAMTLSDGDPYDYAVAERVFPVADNVTVELSVIPHQVSAKPLVIELWDAGGQIPVRLVFGTDLVLRLWHGRGIESLGNFQTGKRHDISLACSCTRQWFEVKVDGETRGKNQRYQGEAEAESGWYYRMSVKSLERLVLRTGMPRTSPTVENFVDSSAADLPDAGRALTPSIFTLSRVRTS